MSTFNMARELGQKIKETDEAVAFQKAKEAYEKDEKANAIIKEFQDLSMKFDVIMSSEAPSQEDINSTRDALIAKEKEIKSYNITSDLINAENELNKLINSIFGIIASTATGKESDCSGGCGGCSGCH